MKIAILSDIHSNIHALEAVWKDINYVQPDEIYCLGDLVGYGAYPNDTIDFVRKNNIPTVMGNYDDAVDSGVLPALWRNWFFTDNRISKLVSW